MEDLRSLFDESEYFDEFYHNFCKNENYFVNDIGIDIEDGFFIYEYMIEVDSSEYFYYKKVSSNKVKYVTEYIWSVDHDLEELNNGGIQYSIDNADICFYNKKDLLYYFWMVFDY